MSSKYKLAPGTQVRKEDFGLLFYTYTGPRLFFLPSGDWLGCDFFLGQKTLHQWLIEGGFDKQEATQKAQSIDNALERLAGKGVIIGL
jgi:putative mycofactocin binding protein MftB